MLGLGSPQLKRKLLEVVLNPQVTEGAPLLAFFSNMRAHTEQRHLEMALEPDSILVLRRAELS